jgi:hypothetical protein
MRCAVYHVLKSRRDVDHFIAIAFCKANARLSSREATAEQINRGSPPLGGDFMPLGAGPLGLGWDARILFLNPRFDLDASHL